MDVLDATGDHGRTKFDQTPEPDARRSERDRRRTAAARALAAGAERALQQLGPDVASTDPGMDALYRDVLDDALALAGGAAALGAVAPRTRSVRAADLAIVDGYERACALLPRHYLDRAWYFAQLRDARAAAGLPPVWRLTAGARA